MKTILFNLFACLTLVLMASCGGSSSERRIAELEDSIAKLNAKIAEIPTIEASEIDNQNIVSNADNKDNNTYVGMYEFTDKAGNVWILEVKDDESAVLYNKKSTGDKAYGSWIDGDNGYIQFTFMDDQPKIQFEDKIEAIFMPALTTEWFYGVFTDADAKNPKKRLPINKLQ